MTTDEPGRVDAETPDLAAEKLAQLQELFPGAFADGVVDAARIGELVGKPVAGLKEGRERYGLMWAGKQEAVASLLKPSRGTLVPDMERSIDFENARNVFIEGDNLEVLKILQKSYNDQVKLIYIDPPYNTTNDFVYNDDFTDGLRAYLEYTSQVDDEGKRKSASAESTGRKHSGWLSMMYPRLVLARNLLKQSGAIAISIDDNEVHSLRAVLDEVFGQENFIAQLVWKSKSGGANDSRWFAVDHEYVLVYARNANEFTLNIDRNAVVTTSYPYHDELGEYGLELLDKQSIRYSAALDYDIVHPDGTVYRPAHADPLHPNATWRWSKERVRERFDELVFKDGRIYTKNYKKEGAVPRSLLVDERFGRTRTGKTHLAKLVDGAPFDNPKPVQLIKFLVEVLSNPADLVLDFFAGSGTTAEAAISQQDGELRRFILVQLPEPVRSGSNAAGRGYTHVSDVTYARLSKVITTASGTLASGLRVLTLTESAFAHTEATDDLVTMLDSSLRAGAEATNIAQEVLLREGVRLDRPWATTDLGGAERFASGGVTVVTDLELTQGAIDAAIESNPRVLVFLEDAFAGKDALKASAFYACKQAGVTMKTV